MTSAHERQIARKRTLSNEQKQERKPSAEAEAIRRDAQDLKRVLLADLKAAKGPLDIAVVIGACLVHGLAWIPEIAAQLAEINSRELAAEIRAREAEAFVLGMQQELQRLQGSGIVIPGFEFGTGKKGG